MNPLRKVIFLFVLVGVFLFSCSKYSFTPKYSSPPTGYYDKVTMGTVYNGNLIVAGRFTTLFNGSNNIAQWNGKSWSGLGSGLSCDFQGQSIWIKSMAVYNGNLIVGGIISSAGGQAVNDIAQWNGTSWSPMANGQYGNGVNALVVYNGNLIAGGDFSTSGSFGIAQWNGTSWATMGTNLTGIIDALVVYKGNLIAAGEDYGYGSAKHPAQWNGASWTAVGGGCNGDINSLLIYNGNLIVQGSFDSAGGVPCSGIAQWNGTAWSALSSGGMYTSVMYNGIYYRNFNFFSDSVVNGWNPSNGANSVIGTCLNTKDTVKNPNYGGVQAEAMALCVYDSTLVIGGWFNSVNGVNTNDNIAQWNGTTWSPL